LILCCRKPWADAKHTPRGIVVIPDFIDAANRQTLAEHLVQQQAHRALVVDSENSTEQQVAMKPDKRRVTSEVDSSSVELELDEFLYSLCRENVPTHFGSAVAWFEKPKVLRYEPGGFYASHADSEQYFPDTQCWRRVVDRDVSLVVYLNDTFEGGALRFSHFGYRYKPRAGDAILFPSDHRYQHEAEAVTAGSRLAIVCWIALRGSQRVLQKAPPSARMLT